mgnify:CR=1 FL=1
MDDVGTRLVALRKRAGLTQTKLAELSGVKRSYINLIENGKRQRISLETAQKLGKVLGVRAGYFMGVDDTSPLTRPPEMALSEIEVSIKAYIPVYAEVCAGGGIEPVDYVAITRERPAPESLRAYHVKGLCLNPDVRDGDTVVVNTGLTPSNGDLVICIIDGEASIKRFREGEYGEKRLEDNDGKYQPEDVYMHGVVIEISRKLR